MSAPSSALSPLRAADLKNLNNALYKLSEATAQIDRAEQAGLDVSQARLVVEDVRTQLVAVKQTYFPGAP